MRVFCTLLFVNILRKFYLQVYLLIIIWSHLCFSSFKFTGGFWNSKNIWMIKFEKFMFIFFMFTLVINSGLGKIVATYILSSYCQAWIFQQLCFCQVFYLITETKLWKFLVLAIRLNLLQYLHKSSRDLCFSEFTIIKH